ncbi:MAG TPA: hypothetical protein VK158_06840 [Acidobacteriota bacterium]|nr:hypothetical protein [Acidobacteriota bacterium]
MYRYALSDELLGSKSPVVVYASYQVTQTQPEPLTQFALHMVNLNLPVQAILGLAYEASFWHFSFAHMVTEKQTIGGLEHQNQYSLYVQDPNFDTSPGRSGAGRRGSMTILDFDSLSRMQGSMKPSCGYWLQFEATGVSARECSKFTTQLVEKFYCPVCVDLKGVLAMMYNDGKFDLESILEKDK